MPIADDATLARRGLAAWYRNPYRRDGVPSPPSAAQSGVETVNGRRFVVLRDDAGRVMKTFQVRGDGRLMAARRVPAALRDDAA